MVEILAPAGSFTTFLVALRAGADAIYLGGKDFGARKMAANFDREELEQAVRAAHVCGVKVYVTVNTLVADEELKDMREYLLFLDSIAVDAIIVQDVGVLAIARQVVPNMELHASTQMTIHNAEGVRFWGRQGISRVALARELALDDIAEIMAASKETGVEIEVFVHGALCICYSGQCLLSSLIGGRSGNRGMCAQPCRLPYTLVDKYGQAVKLSSKNDEVGEYLLSPKDLQAIDILPKLIAMGVHSFKIEGRMKKEEYVYTVTSAYKRAVQAYFAHAVNTDFAQDKKDVAQVFNRGFNTAYLDDNITKEMMSDKRPNNRGVLVGRVESFDKIKNTITVHWSEAVRKGDAIEIWVKVGGRVVLKADEFYTAEGASEESKAGSVSTINLKERVFLSVGDRIFRTVSSVIVDRVAPFCENIESSEGFLPVSIAIEARLGEPLLVTVRDNKGHFGAGRSDKIIETAQKRALEKTSLSSQAAKLGGTLFVTAVEDVSCALEENLFLPLSEINTARRNAIDALEECILEHGRKEKYKRLENFWSIRSFAAIDDSDTEVREQLRKKKLSQKECEKSKMCLTVAVDTFQKAEAALNNGADRIVFAGEALNQPLPSLADIERTVELVRAKEKEIVLALPRLAKGVEAVEMSERLENYVSYVPDGILVPQAGMVDAVRAAIGKAPVDILGDWPLNIYNSEAYNFWMKLGLAQITLSPELTIEQVESICKKHTGKTAIECIGHGRMPMMISEYCLLGALCGEKTINQGKENCSRPCLRGELFLRDRKDILFPVVGDSSCRMQIFNSRELCMLEYIERFERLAIDSLRLECKYAGIEQVAAWTALYRKALDGVPMAKYAEKNAVTRGHYFRGVV